MDQRADIFRGYVETLWIDAEDPILSLVPAPLVGRGIPIIWQFLAFENANLSSGAFSNPRVFDAVD